MPAKHVWGIGLGRTGSRTLCAALLELGYNRVLHEPHFPQLQTADAAAGVECALFYRYLDYRFPDSKFILTTRPLRDWLQSLEHILAKYPVRSREENIPIFRRMTLAGTVAFDEAKHTKAYIRHHDEVREYFKDRSSDLLELDVTAEPGWEKLCAFLGLSPPDAAFPHMNQRGKDREPLPSPSHVRPS
jgi:hypothetical protein